MLKIHNLTKTFGDLVAVQRVSFELKPGEIFALIGPNGSGKTTIVKIISGLLRPTEGTVSIEGYDVVQQPVEAKGVIGYIPDEPAIWPSMTGEEFLHFTGALYGIPEKERMEKIPELLSIFNLKGIEKRYFEDYSRGNKQKFVILGALLHKPKLLVIDEPIVGLDPVSAEIAKRKFIQFAENGGTVLLTTHTLSVAQEVAHRIGILRKGILVATDSIENLKVRAKLPSGATLEDVYRVFAA